MRFILDLSYSETTKFKGEKLYRRITRISKQNLIRTLFICLYYIINFNSLAAVDQYYFYFE